MDILDGLNPEQREAAMHTDGPLLVVAGAGTGKTQVITRRIAYLIQQRKAKPAEVLALTFTEKAAREMEERLYGLIGWESFQVPIMTFHAFGSELLGRFASHIGRSIKGGLLNDTQKVLLLRQHMNQISLSYFGQQADLFEFLDRVVAYIGSLQNGGITAEDYGRYVAELMANPGDIHERDIAEQEDLANIYQLYERVKQETGTFDYNDQLQLPLQILQQRQNLSVRLASEYKYVLVDEYQDTNAVQDQLLRTFIGRDGNLFAVGDDDQAIYGFRGADIGNILAFAEHFEVRKPAVLITNYRSGQAVLDAAYRLICHNNPERLEAKLGINKRLISTEPESVVTYTAYRTPPDELAGVLEKISERLQRGEKASSIAVLAATHAPMKALAKSMRNRGLPYALSTSVNIFEQPELIGLWYLLKWLNWEADEQAVSHVIMGAFIGWTPEQYSRVLELSRTNMTSVEEALRSDDDELSTSLIELLDKWRSWSREVSVSQLAFKMVFETGWADRWRERAAESPRMVRVFEDLQRLLEQMQDFETVAIDTSLGSYSALFPKPPMLEVSEPIGDSEGVQLLTVHASKGLEFDTVYLVACTHRSWSKGRGMVREIPEGLRKGVELPAEHEFRRLMYVAATRSRRHLEVSAATESVGGTRQATSPFITELMGEEVLGNPVEGVSAGRLEKAMEKLQQFYPMKHMQEDGKLPFENTEGWLELSVTELGGYEYCPFEFYLQSVLKIKQPMGPQLAFGTALHKVFEAYYKAQLSSIERSTSDLHSFLDELWSGRGYQSKELANNDRELAHATLDRFLVREKHEGRTVVGSEIGIRFEIPEVKLRLRGKIDAMFELADGIEIRDFKTGRTKTDPEKLAKDAKNNFQLRTYSLAHDLLQGHPPARVTLDYVVTGVEGSAQLTDMILKNHRVKLGVLAGKIRRREFAPNPSIAHSCAAVKFYGTGEYDQLAEEILREANEVQA